MILIFEHLKINWSTGPFWWFSTYRFAILTTSGLSKRGGHFRYRTWPWTQTGRVGRPWRRPSAASAWVGCRTASSATRASSPSGPSLKWQWWLNALSFYQSRRLRNGFAKGVVVVCYLWFPIWQWAEPGWMKLLGFVEGRGQMKVDNFGSPVIILWWRAPNAHHGA